MPESVKRLFVGSNHYSGTGFFSRFRFRDKILIVLIIAGIFFILQVVLVFYLFQNYQQQLVKPDSNSLIFKKFDGLFISYLISLGTLLIIVTLLSIKLVWNALASITVPAQAITRTLRGMAGSKLIKMPISSNEGLGSAGLILNEAITNWNEFSVNLKNTTTKFAALCQELAGAYNRVYFYEVQVEEVYREIEANLENQERLVRMANQQISEMLSDLARVQSFPRKLETILEELNSLRALTINQLSKFSPELAADGEDSNQIIGLVADLTETSAEVDRIMLELAEIEEQSELLALNSAIGAARAGQEGQGFGVVAREIAILVERSKNASELLHRLVPDIQTMTQQIIVTLENQNPTELGDSASKAVGLVPEKINETAAAVSLELGKFKAIMEKIIQHCNRIVQEENLLPETMTEEGPRLSMIKVQMERYLESTKRSAITASQLSETAEQLKLIVSELVPDKTGNTKVEEHSSLLYGWSS